MKILQWLMMISMVTCLSTANSYAQDEPRMDALRDMFQRDYLKVGFVFQFVGDFQQERNSGFNGFSVANMRLKVHGQLDRGFGYLLQTNFINTLSVLDAKMSLRPNNAVGFDAGLFKSPFSAEFLTAADAIDFVNRSTVVSTLAPNRQVGLQISGRSTMNGLYYKAGVFNGNRSITGNDNDRFMYVVRAGLDRAFSNNENRVLFGVNSAYSEDTASNVDTERVLWGGDLRLTFGPLMLAGEYIRARITRNQGVAIEEEPDGWHITSGWIIAEGHQLLVRLDTFRQDNSAADSELVIFGYNYWPTSFSELQVNYVIDGNNSDLENHQLLINTQIAF